VDQPVTVNMRRDGTLDAALFGEIDFTNAAAVSAALRGAVEESTPEALAVDMSAVTFLDSSGIGVLVTAFKAATSVGASFEVVGANRDVYEQLRLTGLVDLFGIDPPQAPSP
jgi:anti-sigma B factor antagonist